MSIITLIDPESAQFSTTNKLIRDGTELQKGVVITPAFLERNEELLKEYWDLFCVYPDIYLDLIKPSDSNFTLFFYQRMPFELLLMNSVCHFYCRQKCI